MTHRIVAATDGSDSGTGAVARAIELAAGLGAPLSIVHVQNKGRPDEGLRQYAEIEHLVSPAPPLPPAAPEPREALGPGQWEGLAPDESEGGGTDGLNATIGEDILRRAVDQARAGGLRDVGSALLDGDPAEAILAHAAAQGADMIVLGSRGLGALRGALQGSVSQKVMHHAPCTVVVVR